MEISLSLLASRNSAQYVRIFSGVHLTFTKIVNALELVTSLEGSSCSLFLLTFICWDGWGAYGARFFENKRQLCCTYA